MSQCPICLHASDAGRVSDRDVKQFNCPRCGGFEITGSALALLRARPRERTVLARLGHAVRRRAKGETWPLISTEELDNWCSEPLPKPKRQRELLLEWMAEKAGDDRFKYIEVIDDLITGVIGAVDGDGADSIITDALEAGLIKFLPDDHFALTSAGWSEVDKSLQKGTKRVTAPETRIIIGHGRSPVWRDLKDFLQDRLQLKWDEFNRESSAGLATTERLRDMLDAASFAFLVMTAEDETAEGTMIARLNVVHESGLFQGKLGFRRAIILLEEGCEEFSNIVGLGQIRFPAGNISAKFEEIRMVLEREKIIEAR